MEKITKHYVEKYYYLGVHNLVTKSEISSLNPCDISIEEDLMKYRLLDETVYTSYGNIVLREYVVHTPYIYIGDKVAYDEVCNLFNTTGEVKYKKMAESMQIHNSPFLCINNSLNFVNMKDTDVTYDEMVAQYNNISKDDTKLTRKIS